MKLMKTISATVVALALTGAAHAATYIYTEGQRDQVAGSTVITPQDAANTSPGFDLGTANAGDSIDIHGRIVTRTDYYTFTATESFTIEWIFGGYALENPGSVQYPADDNTQSGLTSRPAGNGDNSPVNIYLDGVAAAGNTFTAEITSGDPTIFGRMPAGTYVLSIDGGFDFPDALYDIRIQAVPLPAGAVLLLTGLAGLGVARRRRRS